MNRITSLLSLVMLATMSVALSSCNDHTTFPQNAQISLTATLSGSAELPTPVVSPGTGTFTGVLDRASRVLSYTVTYSGFTPTAGHLHRIIPNSTVGNGPVEFPFASLGSPITGVVTLASVGRVDSLINGFYYANLHTPANPGGEIRGNIRVNGLIKLKATLSGAAERPTPVVSSATGAFVGIVDPVTRVLNYTVTYSGLTLSAGHLHRVTNSTTGIGGVEFPFAALGSPIIGTATLTTASRVDSLLNWFYYANLHTTAFPGGEIRGDIKP
ncbi:MAG: CHRD domain-containing protein [Rudanella sp.]|nr:CHRD domain-containing protein [Rudanella sp.]